MWLPYTLRVKIRDTNEVRVFEKNTFKSNFNRQPHSPHKCMHTRVIQITRLLDYPSTHALMWCVGLLILLQVVLVIAFVQDTMPNSIYYQDYHSCYQYQLSVSINFLNIYYRKFNQSIIQDFMISTVSMVFSFNDGSSIGDRARLLLVYWSLEPEVTSVNAEEY